MIEIPLRVADLGRMRFAYSPLAEVAESLYLLASKRDQTLQQGWLASVRHRLHAVDMDLLHAVVPARPYLASFLLGGASDPNTSIEHQLQLVAEMPSTQLAEDLAEVWQGDSMPAAAQALIRDGAAGTRRLASTLWDYWAVALEPHWRSMRAVLDDDVAYRAGELTKGGVNAMLADLHAQVSIQDEVLRIDKSHCSQEDLSGSTLMLVPSVFVWPNIVFAAGSIGSPSLTYPARGVGKLWQSDPVPSVDADSLGALLGRSRAAILTCLVLPHSTTELALKLGQSAPAVSQHLSVLRRSGLVTSWRSGRSVLYRRTALASSIVDASSPSFRHEERA